MIYFNMKFSINSKHNLVRLFTCMWLWAYYTASNKVEFCEIQQKLFQFSNSYIRVLRADVAVSRQ